MLRLHTLMDLLLALERVTLASYVLATFERHNRFSTYAGVQYFILGSLPSAMLLLAFGIFYLQAGTLAIQDLDLVFNSVTSFVGYSQGEQYKLLFDYINPAFVAIDQTAYTFYSFNSEDIQYIEFENR